MNVKELLLEEYEDVKKELEVYDYGSDEYNKLTSRKWAIMDRIIRLEEDESKRTIESMKIEAAASENAKNREHDEIMDYKKNTYDCAARLEQYSHNKEIEEMKRKKSKTEIALDVAKIAVPAIMTIWGYREYDKFQKRVLKFEETGRIVSTAGRELHLPKFMK